MTEHKTILSHVARQISLTIEEEEEFVSILVSSKLKKKAHLITQDKLVDQLYFVVKGCLKAYYLDEAGNKHILQFAIENYWITDFDALENGVLSKLYIEVIEDCVLLSIHKDALAVLFTRIPKFERFFRILFTDAFIALRKRMMSALQKNSKARYIEFCENYPKIEERVTQYHIANYLGITAESLSRIRKELSQ